MAGLQYTIFKGKGSDEVEAFALGEAKKAGEGDKVILNAAADVLPGETYAEGSQVTTFKWTGIYCDLSTCFTPGSATGNKYTFAFKKDKKGVYRHTYDFGFTSLSRALPYQTLMYSDQLLTINGKEYVQTGNSYHNYSGVTFSPDYKWMIFGGRYLPTFKLYDNQTGPQFGYEQETPGYRKIGDLGYGEFYTDGAGPGLFKNGENYYFLILGSNGQLQTLRLSSSIINGKEVPELSERLGFSTIAGLTGGGATGWWRHFGGNKVICTYGTYNRGYNNPENLHVFEMTPGKGANDVYTGVKKDTLTTQLITAVQEAGVTLIDNIMVVNETDVYLWGTGGICTLRYNAQTDSFEKFKFTFSDIGWTNCFFVNPIDNTAIFKYDGGKAIIRSLDAPLKQPYVASSLLNEDLLFIDASLTGFVTEKKGDGLTVETITQPNSVVPVYPQQYGLEVQIEPGNADGTIKPWSQPFLTANGTLGVDDFAVSATSQYSSNAPYKCFTTNTNEAWLAGATSISEADPQYYTLYYKTPVMISSIDMKNRDTTNEMLGNFVFQSSDDGETWWDVATFENRNTTGGAIVTFAINETTAHTYHRFKITSNIAGASGRVSIGSLTIKAQQILPFSEGFVDITQGSFINDKEYVTYPGGYANLATIEGDRETTMGLWLVKRGGPAPTYNFDIIGNVTLNGSEAIFSENSLISTRWSTSSETDTWEYSIKFTTGDDVTTDCAIIGPGLSYDFGAPMVKLIRGTLQVYLSSNGTVWDISPLGGYGKLKINTTYWIKLGWTGTKYYLDLSQDGVNFDNIFAKDSTTPVKFLTAQGLGGNGANGVKYFRGTIDLSETTITQNGVIAFKPDMGDVDYKSLKPVISISEPTSYTVRHKVGDVYLSDTLDYFIEAPQSANEVENV